MASIQQLQQAPLIVLDDLGAELTSDWLLTKVDAIIAERYNRRRATIITTNLGSAGMRRRYTDRIIDRLRGTFPGRHLQHPGEFAPGATCVWCKLNPLTIRVCGNII